jgi:hypothetical protein
VDVDEPQLIPDGDDLVPGQGDVRQWVLAGTRTDPAAVLLTAPTATIITAR